MDVDLRLMNSCMRAVESETFRVQFLNEVMMPMEMVVDAISQYIVKPIR